MTKFGDSHGGCSVAQGILDDESLFRFAEDEADGGLIAGVLDDVIDGGQVKIHLAGVFGFERAGFEIDYDEAAEAEMVKEQIDPVVLPGDFNRVLAAELEEKALKVIEQPSFDVAFMGLSAQREEIEVVGVFEDLLGEIGLGEGRVWAKFVWALPCRL